MKKPILIICKIACLACLCIGISSAQKAEETIIGNDAKKTINLKETIFYAIDYYIPELIGDFELAELIQTKVPEEIEWDNLTTISDLIATDTQQDTYLYWEIYKSPEGLACLSLEISVNKTITTKTIVIDGDVLMLDQVISGFSSTIAPSVEVQKAQRYAIIYFNPNAYLGDGAAIAADPTGELEGWITAILEKRPAPPFFGPILRQSAIDIVNADPAGAFTFRDCPDFEGN